MIHQTKIYLINLELKQKIKKIWNIIQMDYTAIEKYSWKKKRRKRYFNTFSEIGANISTNMTPKQGLVNHIWWLNNWKIFGY